MWTRTDATELMDGKYHLWYRNENGGGRLWAAGREDSLLRAQAEAARWEVLTGWEVSVVQHGRFVTVDEDSGTLT